jgi:hypothetical protein
MNERIKELIMEAVNFRLDPDSDAYEAQISPEDLECLAELIVKECVRYFNEDYERNFETLWREDLSKGMKEHFGVEE